MLWNLFLLSLLFAFQRYRENKDDFYSGSPFLPQNTVLASGRSERLLLNALLAYLLDESFWHLQVTQMRAYTILKIKLRIFSFTHTAYFVIVKL